MRSLDQRFLGIACILLLVMSATIQAQDGGEEPDPKEINENGELVD